MKKLLITVGVNKFKRRGNDLKGCLNDVDWISSICEKNGYLISVLKDKEAKTERISNVLSNAVKDEYDKVIAHFSFHGSQIQSNDPYEPDMLDELICPWDYDDYWDDPFTDNKLAAILKDKNPKTDLIILMDCCHSEDNTRSIMPKAKNRYVNPPEDKAPDLVLKINRFGLKQVEYGPISPTMNHLLFSACKANQTAADAYINGKYNGAFTWALCSALEKLHPGATSREVFKELKLNISNERYSQIPGLEGPVKSIDKPFL